VESLTKIVAGQSFKSKQSGCSAKFASWSPDGTACTHKLRRDWKRAFFYFINYFIGFFVCVT
jgi:hypothetical protein